MNSKRLNQYSGRLTPQQIASGMSAAGHNARRLATDARILQDSQRYPSAASLAALSIEESGKASILRAIALARTDAELSRAWKEFRSHTKKNAHWLLAQLAARGARHLEDFRPMFQSDADHPFLLDHVKQLGFYTDCLGDAHWSQPQEVIDQRLAEALVRIAELFAKGRDTTAREIELWIEHVGPIWRGHISWMKKALSNWYAAMRAEGLIPDDAPSMDLFLWPEPGAEEGGA